MTDTDTMLTFRRDRIACIDWAFFSNGPALVRFTESGSVFFTNAPNKPGAFYKPVFNPAYDWAGSYTSFKELAQRFVDEGNEMAIEEESA